MGNTELLSRRIFLLKSNIPTSLTQTKSLLPAATQMVSVPCTLGCQHLVFFTSFWVQTLIKCTEVQRRQSLADSSTDAPKLIRLAWAVRLQAGSRTGRWGGRCGFAPRCPSFPVDCSEAGSNLSDLLIPHLSKWVPHSAVK